MYLNESTPKPLKPPNLAAIVQRLQHVQAGDGEVLRTPGPHGSKFGKQCSRACCLPSLGPRTVSASLPRPGAGRCRRRRRRGTTRPCRCEALPSPHARSPHKARRRRGGAGGLRPSARPAARRPPPFSASCSLSTSMAPRSPSPPAPPSAAVPGAAAPAPAPRTPAPALAHTPPHAGDRGGGSRREPGGEARDGARRTEREPPRAATASPPTWRPARQRAHALYRLSCSRPLRARAPTHAQERSHPGPPSARAQRRREGRRRGFGAGWLSLRAADATEQKKCS